MAAAAPAPRPMRRGPTIRRLLLGVGALVLLVPLVAVLTFRIYDALLVEQTERRLIGESAVLAEAYRDAWATASGLTARPDPTPPWGVGEELYPVEPVIDLRRGLLPAPAPPERFATQHDGPAWRAGLMMASLLDRVRRVNLSGVRVLGPDGCAVATTAGGLGACYDHLPEVRAALAGRYAAVARLRETDDRPPPLGGMSRRGLVRVSTAMPVFADGRVVGVVRLSRTSQDPLESIWQHKALMLLALGACAALTVAVTWYLSRTIARPVREITAAAEAVAAGRPDRSLSPGGVVPAEVYRLGEALDRMTATLRERADYIGEFASNVSHELRTPLAGIRGAVELLRDAWDTMDAAQRERFLANVDGGAERMQRLVAGLLALARVEHGAAEPAVVDPRPLLARLAERHGDAVRLDLAAAPAAARVHAAWLEAAVDNLLANALRHGAGQPVDLAAAARGDRLEVTVRDRGPGISEANRARIFDRFFTTERDRGGTGLGLALVQAVARAHGGSVEVETGPDGTTMRLVV